MTKLNFKVGNIGSENDAAITGAAKDVTTLITHTGEQVADMVLPSVSVITENTLQLARKPFKTMFSAPNWLKLIKSPFIVGADVAMKAARLPFSRIDDALTYVVNNNLERITSVAKNYTTGLVANIISNNGQSKYKALRGLAIGVEGIGDAAFSLIKLPTGLLAKGTSIVDDFLAKGSSTTNGWVQWLRISPKDFISKQAKGGIINSGSHPAAANDNASKAANDNSSHDSHDSHDHVAAHHHAAGH